MLEIQVKYQQRLWQKPQQKNQQQKKLQKRNNRLKQNFFLLKFNPIFLVDLVSIGTFSYISKLHL
jgi:hypothetical protein